MRCSPLCNIVLFQVRVSTDRFNLLSRLPRPALEIARFQARALASAEEEFINSIKPFEPAHFVDATEDLAMMMRSSHALGNKVCPATVHVTTVL